MIGTMLMIFAFYLIAGAMVQESRVARLDLEGRARWKAMNPFARYFRILACALVWPFFAGRDTILARRSHGR